MSGHPDRADGAEVAPPLVDFARMGRRLRRTAIVLGGLVAASWVLTIPFAGPRMDVLMNLLGAALAIMFVAEVVIVGGSALGGMLRAGERGDRLASGDVGLLPPQLTRRRRR